MNRIRNIAHTAATMASITVLALSLVACGGSDDTSSSSDSGSAASSDTVISPEEVAPFGEGEVAELRALMASFGAPVDETKCMAETLAGKVDQVKLKQMLDASEVGDVDADIDVDTAVMFNDAVIECGLG